MPSQDCTVGTALAFCGYATNKLTGMQAHNVHTHAQAHNVHTHAHTHSHIHTHTHTHTHAHTNAQAHTLTQAHTRTHTLTHAHTLAIAPKQHAKLAQACSSRSSSDSNNSKREYICTVSLFITTHMDMKHRGHQRIKFGPDDCMVLR